MTTDNYDTLTKTGRLVWLLDQDGFSPMFVPEPSSWGRWWDPDTPTGTTALPRSRRSKTSHRWAHSGGMYLRPPLPPAGFGPTRRSRVGPLLRGLAWCAAALVGSGLGYWIGRAS